MSEPMHTYSLCTLASKIRDGTLTPTAVVEYALNRIQSLDGGLNAFIAVTEDRAREAARKAERDIAAGKYAGPLHGIPIAVKDSRPIEGIRHTWGTKLLGNNIAETTDSLVRRIEREGGVVLGKSNLPAFALIGATYNRLQGPTRNPFDPNKMIGGSSGGSAAAVAAGLVPVAQGEDGGGSLRMPASTCGVYTLKPTFGRIGEYTPGRSNAFGHTPMQSAGPITRHVTDAALMLDMLAGPHERDPFSLPESEQRYQAAAHNSIAGYDIAVSPNFDLYPIDVRVQKVVCKAAKAFEEGGANVREISLDFEYSRKEITNAFMLQSNVATAIFGESLEVSYGISINEADSETLLPYLHKQFIAGQSTSAMDYRKADVIRTSVYDTIQDVFEGSDLLVSATLMTPPFDVNILETEPGPTEVAGTPLDEYEWGTLIDWRGTQIANMTGHPAACIPAGFIGGLPIGMDIMGPKFREDSVLAASETFERLRPWHHAYERLRLRGEA
jgi:Asp-tRNA(Asn)/Glu-tRNA(Gln) amidotransferase A subunit family amidase